MANPTAGDVHVNAVLTNFSIAFMQKPDYFVADKVFPAVPVQKQSDRYFTYSRADMNRDTMKKRAPGTESAGTGFRIDNTPTYFCDVWALHKDIDDQIRSNSDSPLDLDRDTTKVLAGHALINREVSWAGTFFTTGVWTGAGVDVTGVSASPAGNTVVQWNDSTATPIVDVRTNNDKIHLASSYRANKMVMGRLVWSKLEDHGSITDRIKYSSTNTTPAIVSRMAVAQIMEIDEILVMDAIKNTGAENNSQNTAGTVNAGESNVFIGGKAALLVYAAPSANLMEPSGGYTFNWTGFVGAGGAGSIGQRIKRFRIEQLESDRIEIQQAYAQKLVAPECGVFFNTIVA